MATTSYPSPLRGGPSADTVSPSPYSPSARNNGALSTAAASSSPVALAAWGKFEQCLALNGLTFEDIKDADAGARVEMIASIGGTSLLFGASVDSGVAVGAAVREGAVPPPSLSGVEMALVSSRWNALVPTAATGVSIPQEQNLISRGGGGGIAPTSNSTPFAPHIQSTLPFLDPTHGRQLLHRGTTDLLEDLKHNLSIGNSAPALAIAAELLHRDPLPMLRVLNEFAPHLSLSQLQEILGVRAGGGGDGSFPSAASPSGLNDDYNYNQRSAALPVTGSAIGSASSLMINTAGQRSRSLVPTLNDIPLRVGAVLTYGSLSAQFGSQFRATFSNTGRVVQLPHCVQEGDAITVLKSSELLR